MSITILERFLDALDPPRCAGCDAAGAWFCEACFALQGAGVTFEAGGLAGFALGAYAGSLRSAVLAFKDGRRPVGLVLAQRLAGRAGAVVEPETILVPVPTTRERRLQRGYDPGLFLARELGRHCGLACAAVLRRTGSDAQRGRGRAARLEARGRYACRDATSLRGREVVLVDDVATTGSTLRDCSAALEAHGASPRGALVLARTL
jgi:predicted amidophosphoribosyltransferase